MIKESGKKWMGRWIGISEGAVEMNLIKKNKKY